MRKRRVPALVLMSALAGAAAQAQDDGSLAEIFEQTAFGGESGQQDRLRRFEGGLEIVVLGGSEEEVAPFAAELGEATGQPHGFAERGNIVIAFLEEAELDVFSERHGFPAALLDCGVAVTEAGLLIAIRVDLGETDRRRCIAQEMTNGIGLRGDLDGRTDTVLASGGAASLTELDRRLLAILYDPRLANGMTREETMAIVEEIIAERGW